MDGERFGLFFSQEANQTLRRKTLNRTLNRTSNSFLIEKAYINGKWVESASGEKKEVLNPSTGEVIGMVPKLSRGEVECAILDAGEGYRLWKCKTAKERSLVLRRWYDLIMESKEELGRLLTLEQGKPLSEAIGEVEYGASFIEWYSEEGKRVYGDIIPSESIGKRMLVMKEAIGVVGCITPWNFPNAMVTRKVAPALSVGCSALVKPATETPFSAIGLAKLSEEAGVPAGVLNVLTGDSRMIGEVMCESEVIRKLSFTGSTEVGKVLMEQSARTVKKVSMELGGNAPFIVFEDADIGEAVKGGIEAKYRNSGQTCVCVNRFIVQEGIYEEFIEKLKEATSKLKVGDGFEAGCMQGPLINGGAVRKVEEHIRDCVMKGGKVIKGGKRIGGNFFEPTIIKDASSNMKVASEETFGPLSAIFKFRFDQEAINLANRTEFGLASYFYTSKINRLIKIAESLESGMIGINTGLISSSVAPFGGVKQSGIGREGSKYGLEDFLEIKYLCIGGL